MPEDTPRPSPSVATAAPHGASSDGDGALQLHLALLAVQLLFSGFHVAGKWVMGPAGGEGAVPPLALACLRVGFVTPVLLVVAWRHDRCLPALRDLPHLALLGALGVFLNQVMFLSGLAYTTATNAAILMPSIPVFAAGVGAALGIERIGPRRLAGIALAVAGALAVLDPSRLTLADDATRGNLLVLANTFCYASFLVLQRPLLKRLPWRTVIAGSFAFGSLGVFAVGGRTLATLEPAALSAGTRWALGYVVLATLGAYMLNTWAVRRSSPTLVAAYTTLQPLSSAGLAALFLGERMGANAALGFALIAAGLWLVSRRRRA